MGIRPERLLVRIGILFLEWVVLLEEGIDAVCCISRLLGFACQFGIWIPKHVPESGVIW